MDRRPGRDRLSKFWSQLKRFLKREPEPPEDPFAFVGAPKKPRPPRRSAAVAEPLD